MTSVAGEPSPRPTDSTPFDHDAHRVQEHGADDVDDAVITLSSDADAPGLARAFVEHHRDHLADHLLDDAVLLVSEVVTNAVKHGRDAIVLRVRAAPPGIGIAVADDGPPIPAHVTDGLVIPTAAATSGRGLAIIAALSDAWGVERRTPPPGKTVWFEIVGDPKPMAHDA